MSEHSAPVDPPNFRRAVAAILAGDLDAIETELRADPALARARGAAPGAPTLLHYTSFNGLDELCFDAPRATPRLARALLEAGAEADALLAGDNPTSTALNWALSSWFTHAGRVQCELTDAYLDGGAALEGVARDGSPLGHAIQFGYTRAVEHLVARGARSEHLIAAAALGRVDRFTAWRDAAGRYAPEALAFTRRDDAVAGRFSWPPARDNDPDALALVTACTHGRAPLVAWLLERGVSPDASVNRGQTALHFAAYTGYADCVGLLLERGARTDLVEGQFERTAAEWARETGEHALAERLDAR